MKLISIVKELQKQGINIKYRVRKDGGILITEVSGMRFKAAEGNRFVRNLTGQSLSEAQSRQREKIKPPKRVAPSSRKKPPIPDDVRKEIQRLQRLYRKDNTKGKPTIRNYRYVAKTVGEAEARRLLKQSEYYIKGIAYTENIEALIQRLHQLEIGIQNAGGDSSQIKDLIDATREYAQTNREKFTETKLKYLIAITYDFQNGWNKAQSEHSQNDATKVLSDFHSNYMITLQS